MSFKRRLALTKMNFWRGATDLFNNLFEWSMGNWKVALNKGKELL